MAPNQRNGPSATKETAGGGGGGPNGEEPAQPQPPPPPPGRPPPNRGGAAAAAAAAAARSELGLRPATFGAVRVVFRAPCRHFRRLLHQLMQEGVIAKGECYRPDHLRRWTVPLTARLRADAGMGVAMRAMEHRLGLLDGPSPVAFCLDGFYHGAAEFGNVFGTDEAPWMLIQSGSTPASLHLQDGDSIFLSVMEASGTR